jgi:catechol 2,3-dioxygenase-like lactoylglutathione lyase family enzyme
VATCMKFYTELLGFEVEMHPAPGFAALKRGSLRLFLNAPGAGGAGQSDSAGARPQPGGWNRFQLIIDDLKALERQLDARSARFRARDVEGKGGLQSLLEDPSGNLVELFQPYRETSS